MTGLTAKEGVARPTETTGADILNISTMPRPHSSDCQRAARLDPFYEEYRAKRAGDKCDVRFDEGVI